MQPVSTRTLRLTGRGARDQPHGRIRPTRAARAEQDKERDNSCAILGEQDKTKDAGGAAPQVITNAALFMIGPTAEELAAAGYSVVAFETSTGRDVRCVPTELSTGEPGLTWEVEARNDNHWCSGRVLADTLEKAGWTRSDLRQPQA